MWHQLFFTTNIYIFNFSFLFFLKGVFLKLVCSKILLSLIFFKLFAFLCLTSFTVFSKKDNNWEEVKGQRHLQTLQPRQEDLLEDFSWRLGDDCSKSFKMRTHMFLFGHREVQPLKVATFCSRVRQLTVNYWVWKPALNDFLILH